MQNHSIVITGSTSINSFRKLFESCIEREGLHTKYRQNAPDLWTISSEELPYLPVAYSNASIDYQIAYHKEGEKYGRTDIDMMDVSLIIFNDNKPCSIWPLTISSNNLNIDLNTCGNPTLPPLFHKNVSINTIKRITRLCVDVLDNFYKKNRYNGIVKCESGHHDINLNEWHKYLMKKGALAHVKHELYVDLSLDMREIKSKLRNRYKSFITSGKKHWDIHILNSANDHIWRKFQTLHLRASGRTTRSENTWKLQHQQISEGTAILIYLNDKKGNMVGGGLYSMTKDEGIYSVGAYDRNLFNKPLGHVVQWHAIQEMKCRGLQWYKIGRRFYPSDIPKPTDKEISISEFKEGFATHTIPKFILHYDVK